jgi:hypothetical protein
MGKSCDAPACDSTTAGFSRCAALTIDLKGENLSTDAAVKIDGVQLRPTDEFTIEDFNLETCRTPLPIPPSARK